MSSDSGSEVTVTVNQIASTGISGTGAGTLRLDLKADNKIEDAIGNRPATAVAEGAVFHVDTVGPQVAITGAPEHVSGTEPFGVEIVFSEAVVNFSSGGVVVTNGTVRDIRLLSTTPGMTYAATIAPSGAGDVVIAVPAGAATDEVGNPNSAAEPVTVGNTIVAETQARIAEFMSARAQGIVTNQPDLDGLLDGNPVPGGGPLGALTGRIDPLGYDVTFFTSRATLQSAERGRVAEAFAALGAVPAADAGPRFDIWTRLAGSASFTDVSDGMLWIGHLGTHYRVNRDVLVGALVQVDYARQEEDGGPGAVEGWGYMAGPYLVARLPGQSLTLDARALWGASHNDVSPLGTYTDAFDTTRYLLRARLSGKYAWEGWTLRPAASVSYFEERQAAYTDSLSNVIPEQIVTLGEFAAGPTLSYDMSVRDGLHVRPSLGVDGVWTFARDNAAAATGIGVGENDLRARLKGGLAVTGAKGWTLRSSAHVDGLGASDFTQWGGALNVVWPLQ